MIPIASVKLLMRMLAHDSTDAMEAAKQFIGGSAKVPVEIFLQITKTKTFRTWSRICAIYVLGFSNNTAVHGILIEQILDETNPLLLRSFAAEALGNLRAKKSIPILEEIMKHTSNANLKKSCRYALSQM
jgi:hypothetical protein